MDACKHTSTRPTLHAHIGNAVRAWKEHFWKLRGIKATCTAPLWLLTCTSVAAKTSVRVTGGAHFRRKHGWKFGFQHAATEYKTVEAGVRVSTSQRNKLVSLFNALSFHQQRPGFNIWNVSVRWSQLIAKLVCSPKCWTLITTWQLFLARPCPWNLLLHLGNRCTLKLASARTRVKAYWIRILWRVFGLNA